MVVLQNLLPVAERHFANLNRLSDGARNAVCGSCELDSQIRVPGRHEAGRKLVHRNPESVRALPRVNLLEILHAPAYPPTSAVVASVYLNTNPSYSKLVARAC